MSTAWSLDPLVIYMKVCGNPTSYEKSGLIHRVYGYFWRFLSLICLLINCFFNIYDLLKDMKDVFVCERHFIHRFSKKSIWLLLPMTANDLFQKFSTPIFLLGVPLVFALQFYLTRRLEKMWILIREIAERVLMLPNYFYRKCRNQCLFLIAMSFMVIYWHDNLCLNDLSVHNNINVSFDALKELAIYLHITNIAEKYNIEKWLDLGLDCNYTRKLPYNNDSSKICYKKNETFYCEKRGPTTYETFIENVSYAIGIWLHSSVMAVLTFICGLILVTSLLAEEIDQRTEVQFLTFSTDGDALSLALENWLRQFDQLHLLVEMVKDFSSPILAITIFYYFTKFPGFADTLIRYLMIHPFMITWVQLFSLIFNILMISLRLGTIVTICNQLQDKVGLI